MTLTNHQALCRLLGILAIGAMSLACVDSDPDSGFGTDDNEMVGDGDGDTSGDGGTDGAGAGAGDGDGDSMTSGGCELPPMEGKVVLGYVPNWVDVPALTASMDFDTLTHIALAFTNPTTDDPSIHFGWVEDEDLQALIDKAHANDVKVLASIAGAAESDIVLDLIKDDMDGYIDDLAAYVEKWDLDGVDVDVEGHFVNDSPEYGPFVEALAARIRPDGKLVTAAVAQFFQDGVTDQALFCFDFINIMTYDYAGGWSGPEEHASRSVVRSRANYWANTRNYPPERIVVGLPFYGYCWGSGCGPDGSWDGSQISFERIEEWYPDQLDSDWIRDTDNDVTINFNSAATITDKTEFAQDFGGVMVWQMAQDGSEDQLFEAIKLGL